MQPIDACELTRKKCQPCEGGVPKYSIEQSQAQLSKLHSDWTLNPEGTMITRRWKLKSFVQAMKLANESARIAEEDQHHPDLHLTGYRFLQIDLTTHAIGGLSENDFILAAKIDAAALSLFSA